MSGDVSPPELGGVAVSAPPAAAEIVEIPYAEAACLEPVFEEVFGPGRFTRTAHRVREAAGPEGTVWFAAYRNGNLLGGVGMTAILVGEHAGALLGPIGVRRVDQRVSVGTSLMHHAIRWSDTVALPFVLLVGDLPYYGRFGFEIVPMGQSMMPGPVDPGRVLARCQPPLTVGDLSAEIRPLRRPAN